MQQQIQIQPAKAFAIQCTKSQQLTWPADFMDLKAPRECKKATEAEETLGITHCAHLHGAVTAHVHKYIKDTLLKRRSFTLTRLTQRLAGPREGRFLQAHLRYPDPSGVLEPPSKHGRVPPSPPASAFWARR